MNEGSSTGLTVPIPRLRVTCGIPKGSSLIPLLFILYLNYFENYLQFSSASMYADDMHTTISARDIDELFQKSQVALGNISEWMRISKMSAKSKTNEYVIIGHCSRINRITDIAKRIVQNYRSITCLPTMYKTLTSINTIEHTCIWRTIDYCPMSKKDANGDHIHSFIHYHIFIHDTTLQYKKTTIKKK